MQDTLSLDPLEAAEKPGRVDLLLYILHMITALRHRQDRGTLRQMWVQLYFVALHGDKSFLSVPIGSTIQHVSERRELW